MSNWKKEPDTNWLIDLHQHISTPTSCSGNVDESGNTIKHGWMWKGPYYSEYGDDGVLEYLFKYISETNKFAVDIGASSGYGGSNVRFLVDKYDWGSVEFDSDRKWGRMHSRVKRRKTITQDNVCGELKEHETPKEFDLLSLDIDSMDWYVLKSLLEGGFNPSVAIIEYNPIFNHDESYVRCYSEKFSKNNTSAYGASLRAYEKLFNKHNHTLVGNVADIENEIYSNNAIFLNDKFIRDNDVVQTIEELHPKAWVEHWKTKNNSDDVSEIKNELIKNEIMESF